MSEDVNTILESTVSSEPACDYIGTDLVDVKIWLIGVAGVLICILCIILNTFFSIVFWTNKSIRMTPVFYFGILAFIDIVMALNYISIMAVPVYMDYFESLPIYHLFLSYFRVVLTESAIVMFLSMLLIVAATTERLLRTFHSRNIIRVRKSSTFHISHNVLAARSAPRLHTTAPPFYRIPRLIDLLVDCERGPNVMADQFNVLSVFLQHHQQPAYVRKIRRVRKYLEQHRSFVCCWCIIVSVLYKSCHFFELTYVEKNCTGFARYEIARTELSANEEYKFWWMFLTRNIVDRIAPFFILVIMNILIIGALHKEYRRMAEPKMSVPETNGIQRINGNKPSRSSLRDATRALISLVTTYLISQTLQVIMTFWETFDRTTLEQNFVLYSYLNDIVSFMPMIAGCIRYPVYCACNKSIRKSSIDLLRKMRSCVLSDYYYPIGKTPETTETVIIPVETKINGINGHYNCEKLPSTVIMMGKGVASSEDLTDPLTDDSEHEWQL
ncbi:hypothetical protein PRIPAC_70274 [Pristionchus pacificus]|uniref:G_PROTEIN_RECEP_F1_2 domain-containing protein n=1 Tax=Pristionchus pacificus TaxID=54126 RepID=A0A2A6CR65_PRIPA|nr:hypothetical protein PRIPAC_70274 [Pristionchus pacificus]|eukprot:PDM80695.1 hypothetical protein PRIPAC_35698 [Pristionchus pacificus]